MLFVSLVCWNQSAYSQVTSIITGTVFQTVDGASTHVYGELGGEKLYAYAQFLVDTGVFSDTVVTKTEEMDGDVDEDFVFIPEKSTDHPVILTDSYTTTAPVADQYSCCFSIPSTIFSDEFNDGLCLAFDKIQPVEEVIE